MNRVVDSCRGTFEKQPVGGLSHVAASKPRQFTSASLFGDAREVQIIHAGECYRLIVTRNGRLVLNK